MSRHIWIAVFLFLAVGSLAAADRPNVVILLSDDQGFADYSFLGHKQIQTPRLDQLAKQSLVFRRGYVPSSLCRPSLATLITGQYPHQHHITSNDPPLPTGTKGKADPGFLAQRQAMIDYIDQAPALPRLLAAEGYVSFQSGKWWEGNHRRGGFTHGMTHGEPARGGRHGDEGLKIGRQGVQPVLDFIDQAVSDKKPFFVWYAPMMPHSPHTPPERLLAKYRDLAPSLEIAKYWAMCEWWDETCGQVLDHLDRRQLADNTIVVYLCDNGWIQDPSADRYAPRSKQSQYEGGLRTPIMLRWPGKIAPRLTDERVLSLDIAPTVLTALGLKPAAGLPGLNLLDEAAVRGRAAIMGECFTHNAVDIHRPAANLRFRWIIADDWKLIVPHRPNEQGPAELYHLSEDPDEARNLAEAQPEKVRALSAQLDAWWQPGS